MSLIPIEFDCQIWDDTGEAISRTLGKIEKLFHVIQNRIPQKEHDDDDSKDESRGM